ncbi:tetratricopeptide repeat protein [Geobacter sp. DSM 9736]|uniref:tetratricopeptide repeat protein n=1 Tax=Geobacter sp. DSM 9736 TaxID=1277350 RepID=UPI000B5045B5|nr:tetratricopeptide repeat protein [Geobacter sp. DSM 9736]SNB46649.1 Tetratricopeptide repeat-containing protein [Geobacter sp. DSM 9736]
MIEGCIEGGNGRTAPSAVRAEPRGVPLALFVIILGCLLVFSRTIWMDFVYDDIELLKERSSLWNDDVFKVAFGSAGATLLGNATPYYRPLLTLSLALDHRLWGVNPAGFHLVNVLLHLGATLIVFFIARRLWQNTGAATLGALLFGVHPVQAEAVSWITARGDIICAMFMLGAFRAYLAYAEKRSTIALGGSLLLCFAALLTKEMGITLPLLVFLYAFFVLKERGGRLLPLLLYVLPVGIYMALRFSFLTELSSGAVPPAWRVYTSAGLVARYMANVLLPFDLRVFYDLPVQKIAGSMSVLVPMAVVAAAVAAVGFAWHRRPRAAFGLVWFLLVLLPVSGLIAIIQPAPMADRYLYLPMAGIAFAVTAGVSELGERNRRYLQWAAALILLLAAGATFVRTGNWKDQAAFRDAVIRDAPGGYFGEYFRAQKLLEQGQLAESLVAFNRALHLNPELTEAFSSRALVHIQLGDLNSAAGDLRAALRLEPRNWQILTNLGAVYAEQRLFKEARQAFLAALQVNPEDANALDNLKRLDMMEGELRQAD